MENTLLAFQSTGLRVGLLSLSWNVRVDGLHPAENPHPAGANGDSRCTREVLSFHESSYPTEIPARLSPRRPAVGCSSRLGSSDLHEWKCPGCGTGNTPPTAGPVRAG